MATIYQSEPQCTLPEYQGSKKGLTYARLIGNAASQAYALVIQIAIDIANPEPQLKFPLDVV